MIRKLPQAVLLALALALALPACRGGPQPAHTPPYPPLEAAELGSMRNVSRSGELWFGGAPREADLDLAVRRGVARVIDLSGPDEASACDVAAICRSKDVHYMAVADDGHDLYSAATVDLVLGELEGDEPVLLFCGNGSRCAAFVAIHRVLREGVPLDLALIEARRAGMKPGEPEAFVRSQVERLRAGTGS